LRINEVSFVDKAANEGARVMIYKRDRPESWPMSFNDIMAAKEIEKRRRMLGRRMRRRVDNDGRGPQRTYKFQKENTPMTRDEHLQGIVKGHRNGRWPSIWSTVSTHTRSPRAS
jgi:hypothetical protein